MWSERLWQDVRHAAQMFRKSPGFALVAIISIAFGSGANVAMFSVADALLLRPLPVPRPGEVLSVGSDFAAGDFSWMLESYPNYKDLRDRNRTFDEMGAFATSTFAVSAGRGAAPQMKLGMLASGNLFRALDVTPELGRFFRPDEAQVEGRDAVVVLSHGMWSELGADPDLVGRPLKIDGIEFTVIGVLPESFSGPDRQHRPLLYVPLILWPRLTGDKRTIEARDMWRIHIKGRLRPGVSITQAQAEVDSIGRDLEREYPEANRGRRVMVRTDVQETLRQNRLYTVMAAILSVLAVAVLIVSCANVAGLLTSRAPLRAREIALRLAIGAARPRLIRQLLTESSLIAAVGGLLGVALGYAGIAVMRQIQFPTDLIVVPVIELDHRTLIFSIAVAVMCTVLCGLIPAIQATRTDLTGALKASNTGSSGPNRRLWGRNLLVTVQVAVSLVVLTISVFVYQAFGSELRRGLGFRTTHAALLSMDPRLIRYTPEQTRTFYDRLTERAAAVNGVTSVTLASAQPLGLVEISLIQPEGKTFPPGQTGAAVYSSRVDEGYFTTMELKFLAGRAFTARDAAGSPRVAIVNEALAQHYWPGQNAVGKRIRLNDEKDDWTEIVGVTPTSRYLFLGEPPTEFLYTPYRQDPRTDLTLIVASTGESGSLIEPLRDIARSLDPDMPVYDVQTMEHFVLARATSIGRILVDIIGTMGLMGMLLSMVGLYGLMSYSVSRRTREIGIRMAIGAGRGGVLRMVLRQGLTPAVWGVASGLALSFVCGRILVAVFPLNEKIGPDSYGVVAVVLMVVAMLAALIPARRASRVDPMIALRDE
jgi:putative ABC transport system permease protein